MYTATLHGGLYKILPAILHIVPLRLRVPVLYAAAEMFQACAAAPSPSCPGPTLQVLLPHQGVLCFALCHCAWSSMFGEALQIQGILPLFKELGCLGSLFHSDAALLSP